MNRLAGGGMPTDPKLDRFRRVGQMLRVALALTVLAAAATLVLRGAGEQIAGTLSVVILVATPLLRTAWLARRWFARGDRRYGAVASGVLAVATAGALAGWLI
jgi:hypothetical protein